MKKIYYILIFLIITGAGGWFFVNRVEIKQDVEEWQMKRDLPPNTSVILNPPEADEESLSQSLRDPSSSALDGLARDDIPEINLTVPFTSQAPEKNWDQPWQDACEEAALLMLDAYYKKYNLSPLFARDEILKIIEWEEERGLENSLEIERVKETAEQYFKILNFSVLENPTIEDIKKSIAKGNPVLAVAYGKDLPNPYFNNGGPEYHALIIRGYTEEKFITNDPGTKRGENFAYYYNDLLNAVHGWNGGNVKEGKKVILIAE